MTAHILLLGAVQRSPCAQELKVSPYKSVTGRDNVTSRKQELLEDIIISIGHWDSGEPPKYNNWEFGKLPEPTRDPEEKGEP